MDLTLHRTRAGGPGTPARYWIGATGIALARQQNTWQVIGHGFGAVWVGRHLSGTSFASRAEALRAVAAAMALDPPPEPLQAPLERVAAGQYRATGGFRVTREADRWRIQGPNGMNATTTSLHFAQRLLGGIHNQRNGRPAFR